MKNLLSTFALVSMLLSVFVMVPTTASPCPECPGVPGPYVDQHWWIINPNPTSRLTALLTHSVDADGVPSPEDLPVLEAAGFTITRMERIGYTFLMENNRVWPFGTPCGGNKDPGGIDDPLNAENWRAVYFRKGVSRLVDKDACVAIYAPLMGRCDYWLPPGQAAWINPAEPLPTFDVWESDAMFDAGGFTDTGNPNLNYDPDWPYPGANLPIGQNLRIDPLTGTDLAPFEYYAIGPMESPLGFEMATAIASWMRKMGLQVDLVAGTWLGMVARLTNPIIDDYQFMTGLGTIWGSTTPNILYDFVYSENLPLWCFPACNYTELDYWALEMISTLNLTRCKEAAFTIQEYLNQYEPYYPMLLYNTYMAWTGPYGNYDPGNPYHYSDCPGYGPWEHPGFIGIVNSKGGVDRFAGYQFHTSGIEGRGGFNFWTEMRGHANRTIGTPGVDQLEINKWTMPTFLTSLNPMEADTASDWEVLSMIEDGLIGLNPYTHAYECWGAVEMPTIEPWVGPGRFQDGGNEEYDNAYNGTHYACVGENGDPETPGGYMPCEPITPGGDDFVLPIGEGPFKWMEIDYPECGRSFGPLDPPYVNASCLAGDDKLGMVTTWRLRDYLYWHDDDPEGVRRPVTTADILFCYEMMINQQNDRYRSIWTHVWDIKPVDAYIFKVFEERRYLFSFENHHVGLYAPKHIWEPWIAPVREQISEIKTIQNWTGWTNDEHWWSGWEEVYMEDPQYPGQMLTHLIGFGPYVYHIGGWEPGVSVHVEANRLYYGGRVCPADANLDRIVDDVDVDIVNDALFSHPGDPNWDPAADVCFPAQEISLDEVYLVTGHFDHTWGPPPCAPVRHPTIYVNPSETNPLIGSTFTINITIRNAFDLYMGVFSLRWNPSIVNVTNVEKGDFLEPGGETYFIIESINYTEGYIANAAYTLLGLVPGLYGNGTLAKITFQALAPGCSEINLYDTVHKTSKLVHGGEEIFHYAVDGLVQVWTPDIDDSCKVDWRDLFELASAYCSHPGDPNWNQRADFNYDGHVGWRDLFRLAANYGKKCEEL